MHTATPGPIRALEPVPVPPLSLSDAELELAGRLLAGFLRDYERSIPAPRVIPELDRKLLAELLEEPFPRQGLGVEQLFGDIMARVVPQSTSIAHPRFLAYVQGPPNGIAPYAEAIAAALNQNCNFWQLSPAASVIERSVISWLSGLFGFPDEAGGLITDGGSAATLTALAAAINDHCPDFRSNGLQDRRSPLTLYTSQEAHHCVDKDAVMLGLGMGNIRKIPVDGSRRMRPDLLRAAIREDRDAGRKPFCVVATAGTVATGAIDPIAMIAETCRDEGLWLHVDGAYGGLFVLSQRRRDALLPCGEADSMALDPHKLLFTPLEAGCVLTRDRGTLRRAFGFSSSYLAAVDDPLFTDYMEYGPQLSRSFKAFKVWCALRTFGVAAFRAAIDYTLDLARYMADRIESEPTLELMAPVTLTAVCLRVKDADAATQARVLTSLTSEGTALLGPVTIGTRNGIRACVTNYRTTQADIDLVIDRVLQLSATG